MCVLDDYRWERYPGVELAVRNICPTVEIEPDPQQAWFRK